MTETAYNAAQNEVALPSVGTGEFIGEFLYHLYLMVGTYGYDCYGEYMGWQNMTPAEQTMHNAYKTVSFAYNDFSATLSDTITEGI